MVIYYSSKAIIATAAGNSNIDTTMLFHVLQSQCYNVDRNCGAFILIGGANSFEFIKDNWVLYQL